MHATASDGETGADALAAVLSDPRLAAYYHAQARPERFPLQIVNESGAPLDTDGSWNTPVAVDPLAPGQVPDSRRATLYVDALTLDSTSAHVSFRFPPEGLAGSATLARTADGAWSVTSMDLVEQ